MTAHQSMWLPHQCVTYWSSLLNYRFILRSARLVPFIPLPQCISARTGSGNACQCRAASGGGALYSWQHGHRIITIQFSAVYFLADSFILLYIGGRHFIWIIWYCSMSTLTLRSAAESCCWCSCIRTMWKMFTAIWCILPIFSMCDVGLRC